MIKIRASSLTNWLDCQRRAATKIFAKEIADAGFPLPNERKNIGAAVGSGLHAGSMYYAENKMKGIPNNKTEGEQRALDSFKQSMENGLSFDQVTPDRNTGEKQILRQMMSFQRYILPSIMPSSVENRLEGQYNKDILLTGQPDLIENKTTHKVIRDLKGSKMSSYHGAQVGGYSLLARAHGNDIKGVIIDLVPRTDIRKEQPQPTSTAYDLALSETLARNVISSIEAAHKLFICSSGNPEAFLPNPSSMLCSPKFCSCYGTTFCKHHKQEKK